MGIELLDIVLDFFNNDQQLLERIESADTLLKMLSPKYSRNAILAAIDKLEKDGYIFTEKTRKPGSDPITGGAKYKYYHMISFDGMVFHAQGSYNGQIQTKEKENQTLKNLQHEQRENSKATLRLTWIIAIGTFVAAVYYFLEIVKTLSK